MKLQENKMIDRVIRVNEVAGIIGVGKSTVWLWDREGKIPKSFKLTPSTTVWRLSEIMEWLDKKQQESKDELERNIQITSNTYNTKKRKSVLDGE